MNYYPGGLGVQVVSFAGVSNNTDPKLVLFGLIAVAIAVGVALALVPGRRQAK